MKTEQDTTHDWERSAHALEWATAIAFSRAIERLSRPPPVALIRRMLDVYISYTAGPMDYPTAGGIVGDLDPTGGFHRARPAAIELRAALDTWKGAHPPPEVTAAARAMVTAYGHPAAGRWDEHSFSEDGEEALLWPNDVNEG